MMDYQDAEKIKQAAYVISQSVCAMIRAMGMTATNQYRQNCGDQIAYDEGAFESVIREFGIHHNAVIETLKVE